MGIVFHAQFYTWGRGTILAKITVKLSEQQTSTYSFGVSLGTKLLHFAFENKRGKNKKERKLKKKKRCSTIQMTSISFYHMCGIKIHCELHTAWAVTEGK